MSEDLKMRISETKWEEVYQKYGIKYHNGRCVKRKKGAAYVRTRSKKRGIRSSIDNNL